MAFTVIVPVFNISIYVFPFLLYSYKLKYGFIFRWKGFVPAILLLMTLGLAINVINVFSAADQAFLIRTLQVVPNYLYWLLLIWFLYSQRGNLDFHVISGALFWGIVASTFFYFFVAPLRPHLVLPFINRLTQNSYAFLLIMFTPVGVRYILIRYGKYQAWLVLAFLAVCGFLSGSRSSSILVLVGGFLSMYINKLNKGTVLRLLLAIGAFYFIGQLNLVENFIDKLNPRTHDLIYETSRTLKTDRSYLMRKLQVEKGIELFKRNPVAGIGLNNFYVFTDVKLKGDFEGSEFVINKPDATRKSSHNSYINLLAEGGLAIALPFGLLILYVLILLLRTYKNLTETEIAFMLGFIMMLVHLYFVNAIVNVFCWFTIGLVLSALKSKSEEGSLIYIDSGDLTTTEGVQVKAS